MTPLDETREALAALEDAVNAQPSLGELDELRRKFLGKTSVVKGALKRVRELPADERPAFAAEVNRIAAVMEERLQTAAVASAERARAARLNAEWADLSLPGTGPRRGARHPVTVVERRCLAVLRNLGFTLVDGPEVEDEFHNFDALNIPKHHPARDMQDTFWLDSKRVAGGLLLRSHTTTVQARVLGEGRSLPIKVASAGRVYRNEAVDATHLAMFHQLEGFWVDRGLRFSDLKGVLAEVVRGLYGADSRFRFKPKFYPYTEPSLGMDLACTTCEGAGCPACHGAGWVTIIGAGMVHRNVLTTFGYDPEEVSGFAFGWGTTRMASQLVGVAKVKALYDQDLRLLHSIHRSA